MKRFNLLLSSVALLLMAAACHAQFPTGWGYRQAITIQSTKIDSPLSQFTVLVTRDMLDDDVVDPSGSAASQANGGDVRFSSDSAGTTQLACDVIDWDHDSVTAAGDADILVAVKVASISSSSNTTIYIWYDTSGSDTQPARTDTYGQDNAYDSSWWGFYPDAGTTDRTVNEHTMTANGSPSVGGVTGPNDSLVGTDFDGSTQYMSVSSGATTAAPLTFVCWGKADDETNPHSAMALSDSGASTQILLLSWNGNIADDPIRAAALSATLYASTKTNYDSTWEHSAATLETASRYAYLNGAAGSEETTSVSPTSLDTFSFGAFADVTKTYFDGKLSLVEIHTVARSAAWIKAGYEQISDPSAFGVPGTPVAMGSSAILFQQQF